MQLRSVTVRGFGPFREPTTLDLDALGDARLVAVYGANGAGKSTLLELAIPGAMFRGCPSRGSLKDLAIGRDSALEATLTNGRTYRVKHLVDAVSGKSEATAHVLDESGDWRPEFDSSKVSTFSAWAESHLPAPEVLFASVFGSQAAGGFLSAKPTERKAILLRCLGIERWEQWAQHASAQVRACKGSLDLVLARIVDEEQRAPDPAHLKVRLGSEREQLASAEAGLKDARDCLEALREEAAAARAAQNTHEIRCNAEADLQARIKLTEQQITDVEKRIANNRGVLAEAEAIRKAAKDVESLKNEQARLEKEIEALRSKHREACREFDVANTAFGDASRRARNAERMRNDARSILETEPDVAAAEQSLEGLREQVREMEQRAKDTEQVVSELVSLRLADADERVVALRFGLERISELGPTDDSGAAPTIATTTLEADDETVRATKRLPEEVKIAEEAASAARSALAEITKQLRAAESTAARRPEIDRARTASEEHSQTCQSETAAADEAKDRAKVANEHAERFEAERKSFEQELAEVNDAGEDRESVAKRLPILEQAEGRIAELEPQLKAAQDERARLRGELDALPTLDPVPPVPDVAGAEQAIAAHERTVNEFRSAVTKSEAELERAQESAERKQQLTAERVAVEAELADWSRLAADLGKKGIQAATIDAALPELVTLANQLLHEAFGSRFTIDVRTQALNSTGKKTIETLDVVVIDTENGRDALAETYSGGERVILGEALSLALTTLACRESGVESPTIVRDESGAALDGERARQWVAMLRRAGELIGASRILFVAHNPELWELADARINIEDGRVSVS